MLNCFIANRKSDIFICLYKVLQPDTLLYEYKANGAFYKVYHLHTEEHHKNRHTGQTADDESYRYTDSPQEYAVKQERYKGFSSGPERKIRSVHERI